MLDKRTTLVLSIVAGALLAFILIFERGTLSTSDLARRSDHVLKRFIREEVSKVELVRGDAEAIVFEREPPKDDAIPGELPDFRIAAPVAARADQNAVGSFLNALEWLMAKRTLEGIDEADRARFGLDRPRFVVRFRVAGQTVALRVGGEAPEGQGIYVGVEGEDRAYVVGDDFVESIDHDLSHFRDKALFPKDFYAIDANSIRLEGDGRTVRFEKEDDRWHVREPVSGFASAGAIDRLRRLAQRLEAERFVAEEARELSRYGLERPWRELTMRRPDDARGTKAIRLRVGSRCGEHTSERYALAGDEGPIVCVLTSALDALSLDENELRESRLLSAASESIEGIVLEGPSGTLELRREDAEWKIQRGSEQVKADADAVTEWLAALRESRALAFEPIEGDTPGRGLARPSATLTLRRSDSDEALVVRLGEQTADGVWVRRGNEAALVRFDRAVAELFAATPLRFQDRALVDAEASEARRITLRKAGREERASRGEGGSWKLEAPLSADADRVIVRELARRIAELRAERFVAERPSAEHGLRTPSRTIGVEFGEGENARRVELRIGAETEGGAFAQLDDGPVFVLGKDTVEALDVSLVSLDALTLDTADAESIRIEREGQLVAELRRDGDRWRTAEGAEPHAERTQALIDRLSTLRAAGVVRYGTDPALEQPAVRITVTRPSGAVSLELGEPRVENDEAFVPVRRSDLEVVYRIRPDLVASLRTYTP